MPSQVQSCPIQCFHSGFFQVQSRSIQCFHSGFFHRYKVALSNVSIPDSFAVIESGNHFPAQQSEAQFNDRKYGFFKRPVNTRYVRILPQKWAGWISFRAGVLIVDNYSDPNSDSSGPNHIDVPPCGIPNGVCGVPSFGQCYAATYGLDHCCADENDSCFEQSALYSQCRSACPFGQGWTCDPAPSGGAGGSGSGTGTGPDQPSPSKFSCDAFECAFVDANKMHVVNANTTFCDPSNSTEPPEQSAACVSVCCRDIAVTTTSAADVSSTTHSTVLSATTSFSSSLSSTTGGNNDVSLSTSTNQNDVSATGDVGVTASTTGASGVSEDVSPAKTTTSTTSTTGTSITQTSTTSITQTSTTSITQTSTTSVTGLSTTSVTSVSTTSTSSTSTSSVTTTSTTATLRLLSNFEEAVDLELLGLEVVETWRPNESESSEDISDGSQMVSLSPGVTEAADVVFEKFPDRMTSGKLVSPPETRKHALSPVVSDVTCNSTISTISSSVDVGSRSFQDRVPTGLILEAKLFQCKLPHFAPPNRFLELFCVDGYWQDLHLLEELCYRARPCGRYSNGYFGVVAMPLANGECGSSSVSSSERCDFHCTDPESDVMHVSLKEENLIRAAALDRLEEVSSISNSIVSSKDLFLDTKYGRYRFENLDAVSSSSTFSMSTGGVVNMVANTRNGEVSSSIRMCYNGDYYAVYDFEGYLMNQTYRLNPDGMPAGEELYQQSHGSTVNRFASCTRKKANRIELTRIQSSLTLGFNESELVAVMPMRSAGDSVFTLHRQHLQDKFVILTSRNNMGDHNRESEMPTTALTSAQIDFVTRILDTADRFGTAVGAILQRLGIDFQSHLRDVMFLSTLVLDNWLEVKLNWITYDGIIFSNRRMLSNDRAEVSSSVTNREKRVLQDQENVNASSTEVFGPPPLLLTLNFELRMRATDIDVDGDSGRVSATEDILRQYQQDLPNNHDLDLQTNATQLFTQIVHEAFTNAFYPDKTGISHGAQKSDEHTHGASLIWPSTTPTLGVIHTQSTTLEKNEWQFSPYGHCSTTCGDDGTQLRSFFCDKYNARAGYELCTQVITLQMYTKPCSDFSDCEASFPYCLFGGRIVSCRLQFFLFFFGPLSFFVAYVAWYFANGCRRPDYGWHEFLDDDDGPDGTTGRRVQMEWELVQDSVTAKIKVRWIHTEFRNDARVKRWSRNGQSSNFPKIKDTKVLNLELNKYDFWIEFGVILQAESKDVSARIIFTISHVRMTLYPFLRLHRSARSICVAGSTRLHSLQLPVVVRSQRFRPTLSSRTRMVALRNLRHRF